MRPDNHVSACPGGPGPDDCQTTQDALAALTVLVAAATLVGFPISALPHADAWRAGEPDLPAGAFDCNAWPGFGSARPVRLIRGWAPDGESPTIF
jgi:hypothetical protein